MTDMTQKKETIVKFVWKYQHNTVSCGHQTKYVTQFDVVSSFWWVTRLWIVQLHDVKRERQRRWHPAIGLVEPKLYNLVTKITQSCIEFPTPYSPKLDLQNAATSEGKRCRQQSLSAVGGQSWRKRFRCFGQSREWSHTGVHQRIQVLLRFAHWWKLPILVLFVLSRANNVQIVAVSLYARLLCHSWCLQRA